MKRQDAQRHQFLARVHRLRRDATEAEKKLWFHLRSRQIAAVKFRRQVSIGPFIADFCCFEPKLVVELDGGQHAAQQAADLERTRFLERSGYRVILLEQRRVAEHRRRAVGDRAGSEVLTRSGAAITRCACGAGV